MITTFGTSILVGNDVFTVSQEVANGVFACLREHQNLQPGQELNLCPVFEYKLYELMSIHLVCCADHECENRKHAVEFLEYMQPKINSRVLFLTRPVFTEQEYKVYRKLLEQVNAGFSFQDARWLIQNFFFKV